MRLGAEATIEVLLSKLDSVYGEVDPVEMRLAKFYSAQQRPDEEVSQWGCRLEDMLAKANERGTWASSEIENMLLNMFWNGLKDDLKESCSHLYDRIKDFHQLRVAVRRVEEDHTRQKNTTYTNDKLSTCRSAVTKKSSQLDDITERMQDLASEVTSLKKASVIQQSTYVPAEKQRNKSTKEHTEGQ